MECPNCKARGTLDKLYEKRRNGIFSWDYAPRFYYCENCNKLFKWREVLEAISDERGT